MLDLLRAEGVQPSLIPVRGLWDDTTRLAQTICRAAGQTQDVPEHASSFLSAAQSQNVRGCHADQSKRPSKSHSHQHEITMSCQARWSHDVCIYRVVSLLVLALRWKQTFKSWIQVVWGEENPDSGFLENLCSFIWGKDQTEGESPNEKLINECALEEVLYVLHPGSALIRNVSSLPYLLYLTVITDLDISCSSLQC